MKELSARTRRRIGKIVLCLALSVLVILLAGALGKSCGSAGIRGAKEEQRLGYIRSLGWEPEVPAQEEKEVLLPGEFPEVLRTYNEIQKKAGFDLEPYAGKAVGMYVYRLCNYPSEAEVLCTLYIHRGKIIGGDIHSTAFRGFMQPLCPKESESKNG